MRPRHRLHRGSLVLGRQCSLRQRGVRALFRTGLAERNGKDGAHYGGNKSWRKERLQTLLASVDLRLAPKATAHIERLRQVSLVRVDLEPGVVEPHHTYPGLELVFGLTRSGAVVAALAFGRSSGVVEHSSCWPVCLAWSCSASLTFARIQREHETRIPSERSNIEDRGGYIGSLKAPSC